MRPVRQFDPLGRRVLGCALPAMCLVSLVTIVACGRETHSWPTTTATFEVAGGERFKIELSTPELIDHAQRLLEGESISAIPVGTVVRDDPGVNEPWSWHVDPRTLEFADFAIEVCDGLPSYVEDGTVTSEQFCPWTAKVIAVGDG